MFLAVLICSLGLFQNIKSKTDTTFHRIRRYITYVAATDSIDTHNVWHVKHLINWRGAK